MEIKNFRDLIVWQQSRELVQHIYKATSQFPVDERFGLTSQIRRAAVSVPSNIAEGHSRRGRKDYIQFVCIAIGSLAEIETQLLLACDLQFLSAKESEPLMAKVYEIQSMLHGLRKSLQSTSPNAPTLMPNAS